MNETEKIKLRDNLTKWLMTYLSYKGLSFYILPSEQMMPVRMADHAVKMAVNGLYSSAKKFIQNGGRIKKPPGEHSHLTGMMPGGIRMDIVVLAPMQQLTREQRAWRKALEQGGGFFLIVRCKEQAIVDIKNMMTMAKARCNAVDAIERYTVLATLSEQFQDKVLYDEDQTLKAFTEVESHLRETAISCMTGSRSNILISKRGCEIIKQENLSRKDEARE